MARKNKSSVCAAQKGWSGAGSNRRPSAFQAHLHTDIRGVAACCQARPGRPAGCKTMAGGCLMWPDVCRRWLPVWSRRIVSAPAVAAPAAGFGAGAGRERGRPGTVIGSVVWLCTATISRPGSGTQLVVGGGRPCDASLRRRPLRRRRERSAALTAMRGVAVGVKNRGQPPEERDHCDDRDDDESQARSCHVIPSLRSEPAGRDRGAAPWPGTSHRRPVAAGSRRA